VGVRSDRGVKKKRGSEGVRKRLAPLLSPNLGGEQGKIFTEEPRGPQGGFYKNKKEKGKIIAQIVRKVT